MRVAPNTALGLVAAIEDGTATATEVTEAALDRLEAHNESLVAFVHVERDLALTTAAAVDEAVARGARPGPLAGVPFGVKDLDDCAGMPTSRGSLVYKDGPPAREDAPHVARLRAAGAIPVGKTAASEFGLDSATSTVAWGSTRNPWNHADTPGGSSGGSAAAVAAGIVPFATASDSGGSTRSPAGFTGLVGLKASQGRIPSAAPGAFGHMLVHGALTATVADTARLLDVMAGPDDRDRTTLPTPQGPYERAIDELDTRGLRFAWSADLDYAAVEPEVVQIARSAAEKLVDAGGLEEVETTFAPGNTYTCWWQLAVFELSCELTAEGVWPVQADLLSPLTRTLLELSDGLTKADLYEAYRRRREIEISTAELFGNVDVLMTPTTACAAFPAEGPIPEEIAGLDARESGAEPFTMLANMTWQPAVSVPAGVTRRGSPVGLQIVGRRFRDDVVLRLARVLEDVQPWPLVAPRYAAAKLVHRYFSAEAGSL